MKSHDQQIEILLLEFGRNNYYVSISVKFYPRLLYAWSMLKSPLLFVMSLKILKIILGDIKTIHKSYVKSFVTGLRIKVA